MPLAVEPDSLGLLVVDRKQDGQEVFASGSTHGISVREYRTKELMCRPILLLACCWAVAGGFASVGDTDVRFVAHGAQVFCDNTHNDVYCERWRTC